MAVRRRRLRGEIAKFGSLEMAVRESGNLALEQRNAKFGTLLCEVRDFHA